MTIPGIIAMLIGAGCIVVHFINLFGKRKALQQPLVQALVTESKQSEWRSTGGDAPDSTSHIVKTTFDLPGAGARTHTKTFSTRIDATAWAARFPQGSRHAVTPHPYAPGEIFLQEELMQRSAVALAFGIFSLAGGAAALYFGEP
jgi:hypothetical protein